MSKVSTDTNRPDAAPLLDKVAPTPDSQGATPMHVAVFVDTDDELPPPPNPAPRIAAEIAAKVLGNRVLPHEESGCPAVDGYEILGKLGRGGMGVVYKARQVKLNRIVALKMVLTGEHAESKELARFRVEAAAVARLQHPNIVQILEAGEQGGRPYVALEFVDGGTLAHKLAGRPQPARLTAQLIETIARAVHFAHQQGIVHRDLKPANVLLARSDRADAVQLGEGPDESGHYEPKITDFGLAKQLNPLPTSSQGVECRDDQTKTGEMLGTPSYMAPEQAEGRVKEVGKAVDTYALGAILYEMLSGRPPFVGVTALETLGLVQHEEPLPPSRLQPHVPLDLETICLKCLQKEPQRRYSSAGELADDLRRFLGSEPIQARAVRPWDRVVKWCRRRPALTALVAVGVLATAALTGGGWWSSAKLNAAAAELRKERRIVQGQRDAAEQQRDEEKRLRAEAEEQRRRAEEAYGSARRNLYVAHINLAQNAWHEAHVARALELLDEYQSTPQEQEDLRGFEWQYLWRLCHADRLTFRGHTDEVDRLAFSPDGRFLASAGRNQVVKVLDASTGQEVLTLRKAGISVAFSPDGKRLATGGNRWVKIWDALSGEMIFTLTGHKDWVADVAFSPDGGRIASASHDTTVRIWDAATGQMVSTMAGTMHRLNCVAFSPDGQRIAATGSSGFVTMWELTTGQEVRRLVEPSGVANQFGSVAFSPDGTSVAAGSKGSIVVWDIAKDGSARIIPGHVGTVASVAFSHDGRRLASGGFDQIVRVWDVVTAQELQAFRGHVGTINSIAFSPDGQRLASASRDNTVKVWDATSVPESRVHLGHNTIVETVAFSPDGRMFATASGDSAVPGKPGELKLWDATTGEQLRSIPAHDQRIFSVAFSPDGERIASASQDKTVKIWDVKAELSAQKKSLWLSEQLTVFAELLRPRYLASAFRPAEAMLTLTHHADWVTCAAYSPDGRFLATGSRDRTIRILDSTTGHELRCLTGHSVGVTGLSFSADGKFLASCSGGANPPRTGEIVLWDVDTGQKIRTMRGHSGPIRDVVFSPDGKRIASTGQDKTIKLWDVATGDEALSIRGHNQGGYCLAYSPDGRRLASGSNDINAKIWDTSTGRELLTLRGHSGGIHAITFSPDGLRICTGSYDGSVRIWDATPLP